MDKSNNVDKTMKQYGQNIASKLITISLTKSELPRTKKILIIFDPITLPIIKLGSPLLKATIDVTNSGTLVPNATNETDMTILGTLKISAIAIDEFINKCDPYPNKKIPMQIKPI